MPQSVLKLIDRSTVVPVLTISDPQTAVPLAEALSRAGLSVVEVTLRTESALDVAEAMIRALPNLIVGIGTVVTVDQLKAGCDCGARFAVSPGLTPTLAEAAQALEIPYLPGVQTVSEVMRAQEFGFDALKLFPAELAGGVKLLRQFAALFPTVRFFPTGGINERNLRNYLQEPNVFSAGGSWLAPADLIDASDWRAIEKLASNAAQICQQSRTAGSNITVENNSQNLRFKEP